MMEKLALSLLGFIAVIAVVGLVKLDTNTGNAYYNSYSKVPVSKLAGSVVGMSGTTITAMGASGIAGEGTISQDAYQMHLLDNWRNNINLEMYIDGAYCTSVPVAVLLNAQQILYNGAVMYNLVCA